MRFPCLWCALVLSVGTLTAWGAAAAAAPQPRGATQRAASPSSPAASEPAVWIKHDLVVNLRNLPKRYSCDDLWYKFRDVLLRLGARPNMQILAYRCESVLGVIARSPSVHLQFEMPQAVQGAEARWADLRAFPRTVRLEPGEPSSLDASDCELLRQIKGALLPALSDRVVGFRLPCQAPPGATPAFGVSVQALIAANAADTRLAASSSPAPGLPDSGSPPRAHPH